MRTKALILFFPFAVFLAETASFIPAMQDKCAIVAAEKSACAKEKKQDACTRKKEKSTCTNTEQQDKCSTKKEQNKIPVDNNCDDNPDCSTCPVCYTFIFQHQYEWPAQQFVCKKNYSLINAGYLSAYTTDVWKPPNGFLYTT